RRRHTSFSRDWSSDVCSSDLGPPSPGSIFAYFAVSPPSGVVGMIIQVLIAAAVAFAAAWFLLVTDKTVKIENEEFEAQQAAEAEIGRASCRESGRCQACCESR